MKVRSLCFLFSGCFVFSSCKPAREDAQSLSQTGGVKTFTVSSASPGYEIDAKPGPCAKNLSMSSMSDTYCFSEIPAALIKPPANNDGISSLVQVCVDTSKHPESFHAAAIVLDSNNKLETEAFGNGPLMVVGAARNDVELKVFVGFRDPSPEKSVKLRIGRVSQFSLEPGQVCSFVR